ncbi:hypothetical protein AFCDBAGC_1956 [Methylobacterium cerastii]|uniref:Uncharacterized protein n=1 Tax=Methylobacterium cerastii TaxID=932741 RepID=A0ABQ4QFU2_9HYPH|nr:transcriptional regulator KorA [Methylobacterium cerastii]GJD44093.1 hypothetical protein AFCDBAGC_1956 [Methylobacterium cerastii]
MNTQYIEETSPIPFTPELLLDKLPVPMPSDVRPIDAPWDAVWSEMELRGTLIAAHQVLAMGRPIADVAAELGRVPSCVISAFNHLLDALRIAVADPSAPYSSSSSNSIPI